MKSKTDVVDKVWGKEVVMANNSKYCGKLLQIKQGYRCSYHMHPVKEETFYLNKGKVRLNLEGKVTLLKPGDVVHIKPQQYHTFLGLEDSEIIEISTTHSDGDVVRKDKSTMLSGDLYNHLFDKKEILVVGDLILDKYVYGDVDRISPEAPIPVHKVVMEEYRLGGAANVAWNLSRLDQKVILVGMIGTNHGKLTTLLNDELIDDKYLLFDRTRPTTLKTRIIARNHHIVRIDKEVTDPMPNKLIHGLRLPPNPDAVIISDYNKGCCVPELISKIVKKYGGKVPILVDPKSADITKYPGVTLIKPNRREFEHILTTNHMNNHHDLINKIKLKAVVVTEGPEGFTIFEDKQISQYPIYDESIVPVDITGAGDTFMATMATAMATGFNLEDAACMGNFAAGITIKHIGTYAPTPDEFATYNAT